MTRVSTTAIAAVLALGASGIVAQGGVIQGAWAQSSDAMSPPAGAAITSKPAASNAVMKNPLSSEDISQITGSSVAGRDGNSIGRVSTVLMDPSSKKVDRLVIAEGGVLGVGSHLVALPVDSFKWDSQNHNFIIQKTVDDLKAMPEWQRPQLAESPPSSTTAPVVNSAAGAASVGSPAKPVPPSVPNAVTPSH